jgi:hypothetical protein
MNCGQGTESLMAGFIYFAGWVATSVVSAIGAGNPPVGALGLIQCGAICFHARLRGAIRKRYRIEPDCRCCCECCSDFCCAMCCYSCAMAQEQQHLDKMLDAASTPPPLLNKM